MLQKFVWGIAIMIVILFIVIGILCLSYPFKNNDISINKTELSKSNNSPIDNQVEQSNDVPLTEMKIINSIVDFGDVRRDTVLFAQYNIMNNGKNPLIIYDVNPDCLCTSHNIANNIVPINETTTITLEFDTKEKIGKQVIYTTLSVNTELKMYILTLKANVNGVNESLTY